MKKRSTGARRFGLAVALVGVVGAVALAFVPAALESTSTNHLFAYVVSTNRGPIPACADDGSNCGDRNNVWFFIHVVNANRLTNSNTGTTRETLPNAFVVSSIDSDVFLNEVKEGPTFTLTPPPNPSVRSWSGHWPSTVKCPGGPPAPCNEIHNPAVVPGENTAILYTGWVHNAEPNGTRVFKYTIHGTLNGTPVDLTASSQPISMTG